MTRSLDDRARWLSRHILPHEAQLRGWLRRHRVADLDVDDIVQETYAILAERDQVEDIQAPRAYLFRVAYSVILTHVRRARILQIDTGSAMEQLEIAIDQPSPEQVAIDRNELAHLAAIISSMPPKTQQAFVLRRVHGLSQREVAERMGISENTVEKHISKGFRLMMAHFRHGGKNDPQTSSESRKKVGLSGRRARLRPDD